MTSCPINKMQSTSLVSWDLLSGSLFSKTPSKLCVTVGITVICKFTFKVWFLLLCLDPRC